MTLSVNPNPAPSEQDKGLAREAAEQIYVEEVPPRDNLREDYLNAFTNIILSAITKSKAGEQAKDTEAKCS